MSGDAPFPAPGSQIQNVAPEEAAALLGSRPEGLDAAEAAARRAEVGPNTLEAPKGLWWLRSLARQFTNFFTLLLILAAAICFVGEAVQPGENMDVLGYALFGVSLLNALFSFVQEFRAEKAMEEIAKFLPRDVRVLRGGTESSVPAEDLVPGDVVALREGDRIPADARLVAGADVVVNNAPLTGESLPLPRTPTASDATLLEADNILFAGCSVQRGSGRAVVFATGFRSQFGRIALLSRDIRRTVSPLEHSTAQMVRVLSLIAVGLGATFFAYGVATGASLWVSLVFMMGIIVANVPEGLLPTFTLSLAMGSLRMARRNVLVKSLNAVEALGAVHVICTDKTGTLTANRLTVTRLAGADGGEAEAGPLLAAALAASDVAAGDGGFSGDPLDVAIAERLAADGGDVAALRAAVARDFAFDVEKRRSAGITGARFVVKGAWESLAPLLSAGDRAAAEATVHDLARRGHRVIAVAARDLAAAEAGMDQDALEHDLTLLGFLGLEDPIRPEVPGAAAQCRAAGIAMVMITGDHPDTAAAIARRAGILDEGDDRADRVITGDELDRLREGELVAALQAGAAVFARATPEQKMKIVAALHQMDKVVAVTGDGVNDAPALKAADVGVAMGRTGTDVAREAAQVILLDDNFASIVAGIEEGRTIFANIRKFTNYVLVSNGPEIIPYLLYILFPVPLALTVIQILAIDLGTDIIPSMSLGQEKPDPEVMRQPPRDRHQGLLTAGLIAHSYGFLGLIEAAFSLSLFFWVLHGGGWHWGDALATDDPLYRSATGIALSSILLMQIGNLFGRRSRFGTGIDRGAFANPLLVAGVLFELAASWAILYVPAVGFVLGTGPVPMPVYGAALLGPLLIFALDYGRKVAARRLSQPPAGAP
ncbi:MAG: cation-transporting P-type ATPase [Hyphomicrobiales bacterium]|nr:cation-transporting P-type ATPase [Hyphomicrobiales bacterium]